jgi:hypothetical protein
MSISVACLGCSAKLNAPDSAAGKKVKCPKPGCGTVMLVPALLQPQFEVVEDDPPPKPKPKFIPAVVAEDDEDDRPRKKSRRDDDDDDDDDDRPRSKRRRDDDDDDDRPRKKKKKKQQGMGAGLIVAIALGGILVLGGVGYGVYALVSKKSDSAGGGGGGGSGGGPKAAVPTGWVEYRSDKDKFRAYFPSLPQEVSAGGAPGAKGMNMYIVEPRGQQVVAMVIVIQLNPGTSQQQRDALAAKFNQGAAKGGARMGAATDTTWMGLPAKQSVVTEGGGRGGGVMRFASTDATIYIALIGTESGGRLSADLENGFFDNFELIK